MNNELINQINIKTCNKFNFLRLKQVFFDVAKNTCLVTLIYPSKENISDQDKQVIKQVVVDFLNLENATILVKINKSFVEEDLILKETFDFLHQNNPVLYNGITYKNLDIQVVSPEKSVLTFSLEEDLYKYFNSNNLERNIIKFLENNFCCDFEVKVKSLNKENFSQEFLTNRFNALTKESDLNAIIGQTVDKYFVTDKKVIVGKEINFNPRHISSLTTPTDLCVVAGRINFLTEKTYKSKRTKTNKDGTKEQIVKPYFNFQIKEDSASLHAVIFPSKANYHKMHLLKNGDQILVMGKLERYNDRLELSVKDISLCKIPSKTEIQVNVNKNEITDYRFVKPLKYSSAEQSNLFDTIQNYSREVQNHTFVVYDFETTGVDYTKDEIIEIGALKIVNGVFTEVFSTLVKPKRSIPPEASRINRITDDMVKNCYAIEQVICDFYLFCKDCQMVGYNSIAFDSQFLIKAGALVGLEFNNTQLDAFLLAKDKLKGLRNYKLGTVAKYLEVNLVDAHRALNDVIATAEVFLKLY